MAETSVETPICNICGAEVREGSLYCYNCGGSVILAEPVAKETPVVEFADPVVAPERNGRAKGSGNYDPARNRADRSNRRKVRASIARPVEVVWEPRSGFSWPFVIGSLVLTFLALTVIFAAIYLR